MSPVPHLGERLVEERVPVPHADVDRPSVTLTGQRLAQSGGLEAGQLAEGRAASDRLVVMRDLFDALRRDPAALRHDLEERPDVFGLLRPAERDQQHRVDAAHVLHLHRIAAPAVAHPRCGGRSSAIARKECWAPNLTEGARARGPDVGQRGRHRNLGDRSSGHDRPVAVPQPRRPSRRPIPFEGP